MLVLTRRSGESIAIGDDIRIRVLRTNGSRVRIGIEAPADVRILREQRDDLSPKPEEQQVPQGTPLVLEAGCVAVDQP